ncbi:hypothetical protein HYY74_04635 [Candidatus Woesearchaeota archaeon]|nr:hypothetical protein [Candidatus Woesearchaeota archaeon]
MPEIYDDHERIIGIVSFLLRAGLSAVFLYAATASFLEPFSWIGFFPQWLRDAVPPSLLLHGFSAYQLVLALWLVSGKHAFHAAVLSSLTLLAIIGANIGALDIIFRDIAILFSSVALAIINYRKSGA